MMVATVLLCSAAVAGDLTHEQGDVILQGGVGLGIPGWYGNVTVPPVSAVIEYGFHDVVSVGATAGYAESRYGYLYGDYRWEYKYSYTAVGVRGCFHPLSIPDIPEFPHSDKLDLYAGGIVGAVIVSHTVNEPTGYAGGPVHYQAGSSYPLFGAFLGARYYFVKHIAATLEMGHNIGWINAALTARF